MSFLWAGECKVLARTYRSLLEVSWKFWPQIHTEIWVLFLEVISILQKILIQNSGPDPKQGLGSNRGGFLLPHSCALWK